MRRHLDWLAKWHDEEAQNKFRSKQSRAEDRRMARYLRKQKPMKAVVVDPRRLDEVGGRRAGRVPSGAPFTKGEVVWTWDDNVRGGVGLAPAGRARTSTWVRRRPRKRKAKPRRKKALFGYGPTLLW